MRPTTPIETIGDAAALERALTNLVQNAIQHGPRRGTIGIRVSRPASIEVTDEGAGIPADQREQIFEPFYRLTPLDRGAGLGLNMVREIVLLHGGHVSVADGADRRRVLQDDAAASPAELIQSAHRCSLRNAVAMRSSDSASASPLI